MQNSLIKLVPVADNGYRLDCADNASFDVKFNVMRLYLIAKECFGSWVYFDDPVIDYSNEIIFYLNTNNGATPEIFKRFIDYQFRPGVFDYSLV